MKHLHNNLQLSQSHFEPFPNENVVRFDVTMNDVNTVEVLDDAEEFDGEEEGSLRHRLLPNDPAST